MSRDPKHDYKSRCIYHITICKAPGCPNFSRILGSLEQPVIVRSRIGEIIESQILNFPNLCSSLQPLQYVIMPDHIHFAIFAREYLPRVLGNYIGDEGEVRAVDKSGISTVGTRFYSGFP